MKKKELSTNADWTMYNHTEYICIKRYKYVNQYDDICIYVNVYI